LGSKPGGRRGVPSLCLSLPGPSNGTGSAARGVLTTSSSSLLEGFDQVHPAGGGVSLRPAASWAPARLGSLREAHPLVSMGVTVPAGAGVPLQETEGAQDLIRVFDL
jgi:hypothetical protein